MSTSKGFKDRTEEENVKILEKAINSGSVPKETVILWIYNKARKVKKTSINTYLRHLRTIFNKAYEWGYISKKIKVGFYDAGKRLPRVLSRNEKIKIYRYSKKNNYRMYRIIKFALWTGTRRTEIYNLGYPDIKGDMAHVIGKGTKNAQYHSYRLLYEAPAMRI